MRWSRILGLVAVIIVVLWAVGSLLQLLPRAATLGGIGPTLVMLLVLIGGAILLGTRGAGWLTSPYW